MHISGFRPSKTPPKFNERTPRERKKNENCGGRREKKERNFGRAVRRRAVRRRVVQRTHTTHTQQHTTTHHNTQQHTTHRFTTAHEIDDNMDRSHGFATHTRRQQIVHVRLRPISTSVNFDFGQFRLRPISTSANSISASWPKSNCPKSNWPKSSILGNFITPSWITACALHEDASHNKLTTSVAPAP